MNSGPTFFAHSEPIGKQPWDSKSKNSKSSSSNSAGIKNPRVVKWTNVRWAVDLPQIKHVCECSPYRSMLSSYLAERTESNSITLTPLCWVGFAFMLLLYCGRGVIPARVFYFDLLVLIIIRTTIFSN